MSSWLRSLSVLGGLALLTTVGLGGWASWQVRQEAARWPSLADTPPVQAPTAPVTGDGRAWPLLAAAAEQFHAAADSAVDYGEILSVEGRPALDQLDAWQAQAGALATLRTAIDETQGLALPLPRTLDDPSPDVLSLLHLSRALLLKAWADAEGGQPQVAVEELARVVRLGARLVEGESGLIGVMVGLSAYTQAMEELLELLTAHHAAHPALLAQAGAALVVLPPGGLARGLATEAQMTERLLESADDPAQVAEALGDRLRARLTYDPELTVVWHRLRAQAEVDAAARPRWERPAGKGPLPWEDTTSWLVRSLHNPAGRTMLSITTPDTARLSDREDAAVAAGRLAALWIAARRYALDHDGQLPPASAALVPAFLAAPLVDPFDGQPLRLEGGSIWSVGEDQLQDPARLRWAL